MKFWRVRIERVSRATVIVEAESANAAYDALGDDKFDGIGEEDMEIQYTISYPDSIVEVEPEPKNFDGDVSPGWPEV